MKTLELVLAVLLFASAAAAEISLAATSPRGLPVEPEMQAFVGELLGMVGLNNKVRVVVDPEATGCGYATTIGGEQYIGINLECSGPLRTGDGYNYRAAGLVAHEVCHLLGGHTTNATNSHREESEADECAGFALFRLGASLKDAQTFYRSTSPEGSKSHPPRATRLASVERGWNRAKAGAIVVQKTAPETPTSTEVAEVREEPLPHRPVPQPRPIPEPEERPETVERTEPSAWAKFLDIPLPWR